MKALFEVVFDKGIVVLYPQNEQGIEVGRQLVDAEIAQAGMATDSGRDCFLLCQASVELLNHPDVGIEEV